MISGIPREILLNQSSDFVSSAVYTHGYNGFSVAISASNLDNLDCDAVLELSNDGDHWVSLNNDAITMNTVDSVALFDYPITGVRFFRVKIVFATGSADFEFNWSLKEF